ncbi:MAG: phospholipid carrier-dependent glycosyltransferase, partial [Candidatus Nealsonbacteria bacterium]|nr:phospholipid carrier-dependent glycosyltransferase [Candidatus Nealsonbacteria bacterium]
MSDKTTNLIALLLLSIMGLVAFASYQEDSLTMDELSHIPAGYSYVSQQDFRINPEHPPLIKDLAGFPLLFLDVNFPSEDAAWTEPVNGQWWYGWKLLFNSNNNADLMIFWARLPMIFILLSLGFILFWWVKKEFDKKTALLVLALFSFSPTLIAHGKLVTTDVGAALGFLVGIIAWLWLLRNPSLKNAFITGLAFGFCMLLKFSLVLLIPTVGIMTIVYALLHKKNLLYYIGLSALAGIVGVIFMILPVYLFHVANYPVARQLRDTQDLLSSSPMPFLRDIVVWMSNKPILRALGHYFLGLLMATQRTAFGNTVYFLGMVSGSGWWYYFPVVYFLKTPVA